MDFFKLQDEEKTKIILEEAKNLENILNDNLLITFGKLHNIKDEFNLYKLKQEVIAKTGLFLTVKKKYALHIINKEGVVKDELFIKGLVTERSDYPSTTRKRIKEIVDLILRSDSINFSVIRNMIEESRKEIYTLCMKRGIDIAKPVKYNKAEYKKVPYQVLSMNLWNKLMYDHFVPGAKGYLFRIKGVDFNHDECPDSVREHMNVITELRPKYIAIPEEEEVLPNFFIMDMNAMMEFCWDKRIKEILEPIDTMVYSHKKSDEVIAWE